MLLHEVANEICVRADKGINEMKFLSPNPIRN